MSKNIKLDDKVYSDLEEVRLKKETYSQAVARLIEVYRKLELEAWSHTGQHPQPPGQSRAVALPERAQAIIQEVCQAHGISPDIVKGPRRTRFLSLIRWEITRRLRKETPLTWAEIGGFLGRAKSYRGRGKSGFPEGMFKEC